MKFQKFVLASLLATGCVTAVQAADPAPAPEPESTLSFNLGVVSEYRYRGIAQSAKMPALQGGFDYADKSGAYIGSWASSITWIKDSDPKGAAKGPVEIDIYGGYKGALSDDVAYDLGVLQYWYSGNNLSTVKGFVDANTFEVYGALSMGAFTAKLSNSTGNLFGYVNSKNSRYLDVSYTLDLGDGLTIVPHLGNQYVANNAGSYTDYAIAVNKDMEGTVLSATLLGTDYKTRNGSYFLPGSGTKELSGSALVLGVKKNF
jgi:uncharacterized protein (TIGR02001 family)